jgi:hypothetical protein
MKTSHKSDELKKIKKGGVVHKSGTYAFFKKCVKKNNIPAE